jgi:hypothetical protein
LRQIDAAQHGIHRFPNAGVALDVFWLARFTIVKIVDEKRAVPI